MNAYTLGQHVRLIKEAGPRANAMRAAAGVVKKPGPGPKVDLDPAKVKERGEFVDAAKTQMRSDRDRENIRAMKAPTQPAQPAQPAQPVHPDQVPAEPFTPPPLVTAPGVPATIKPYYGAGGKGGGGFLPSMMESLGHSVYRGTAHISPELQSFIHRRFGHEGGMAQLGGIAGGLGLGGLMYYGSQHD